ncbi:hypothetical protein ACO0SA_002056 [Hanseniaspora valbyensis]
MSSTGLNNTVEGTNEQDVELLTYSKYFQINYDFMNSSEEELFSQDSESEFEEEHTKKSTNYGLVDEDASSDEEDLSSDEDLSYSDSEASPSLSADAGKDESAEVEGESEYDSDYDDDSDSKPYGPDWYKKPQFRKGPPAGYTAQANKFLKSNQAADSDFSDSDEDEDDDGSKNKVKSSREKLLVEFFRNSKKIDAAELTGEWEKLLEEYESTIKLLSKFQQQNNQAIPNIFVKILLQLEDAVNSYDEEHSVTKSKSNSKAYNSLKQRFKKTFREYQDYVNIFNLSKEELFYNESLLSEDAKFVIAEETKKEEELPQLASQSVKFFTTLNTVLEHKGKKNTDIHQQIETMVDVLENLASDSYEKILAYLNLIPLRFEATNNMAYQPLDQWRVSFNEIDALFKLLEDNIDEYIVSEVATRNDFLDDKESLFNPSSGKKEILGSIFAFVERLDSEFSKSLLHIDYKSMEYVDRLRNEQEIYNMILRTQLYLEKTLPKEKEGFFLSRVLILRLNHIYYKPNDLIETFESEAWEFIKTLSIEYTSRFQGGVTSNAELIDNLVAVFKTDEEAKKLNFNEKAHLFKIYYYALNDEYTTAVALLENFAQEGFAINEINKYDSSIQILFNRVIVQLGFSSFKNCLFNDSQSILRPVSLPQQLKEFMGQKSVSKYNDFNDKSGSNSMQFADGVKLEDVHLPFHKHINLDLIDTVFLTCSLINDVPKIAALNSRCVVSEPIPNTPKTIKKKLDTYEKAGFHAPAESQKDFILHAAIAMQKGDWKKAMDYVSKTAVWNLFTETKQQVDLVEIFKTQTLKTYIFNIKKFYSKLSIAKLDAIFELGSEKIKEILKETFETHEVEASIEEDSQYIIFQKGIELPKLEELCLKLNRERKNRRYKNGTNQHSNYNHHSSKF